MMSMGWWSSQANPLRAQPSLPPSTKSLPGPPQYSSQAQLPARPHPPEYTHGWDQVARRLAVVFSRW